VKTRAQYRAYDPLSGEHRPSAFFAANSAADERVEEFEALRAENAVLRQRVQALEALLVEARSERDSIAAVRNWEMS
jgi:hypothetical protein